MIRQRRIRYVYNIEKTGMCEYTITNQYRQLGNGRSIIIIIMYVNFIDRRLE